MQEITVDTIENEKLKWEKWARQIDIIKFYSLAKKYGFCFPGCECQNCIYSEN